MTKITMTEKKLWTEEGWDTVEHDIYAGDDLVGKAYTITYKGDDVSYLEDIYIKAEYRNNGIGTATIQALAKKYGYIYFAPTDENNKRLYDRIAQEEPANMDHDAIDQGYGVYFLEG